MTSNIFLRKKYRIFRIIFAIFTLFYIFTPRDPNFLVRQAGRTYRYSSPRYDPTGNRTHATSFGAAYSTMCATLPSFKAACFF